MRNKVFSFGGAGAAIVALLVGLPLYAGVGVDLSADMGRSVKFTPLVRHMMSQVHCYDTGTDDCEEEDHYDNSFTKEYTMGFLFNGSRSRMSARGFEPLFLCKSRHDASMMVTAGTTEEDPRDECRDAGFRAKRVGYISPSNEIEAPWELYRCVMADGSDTLLTHDTGECDSQGYEPAELLGYLYAGGPQTLN